jgi:hypothetical protein
MSDKRYPTLPACCPVSRIKRAAKMAGLGWQTIAARPSTALAFCEGIERVKAQLDMGMRTPATVQMAERLGVDTEPVE